MAFTVIHPFTKFGVLNAANAAAPSFSVRGQARYKKQGYIADSAFYSVVKPFNYLGVAQASGAAFSAAGVPTIVMKRLLRGRYIKGAS